MKQFLKFTLATIFGIFLSVILLSGFFMFLSIVLTNNKTAIVSDNSVLKINLKGDIVEKTNESYIDLSLLGLDNIRNKKQGLNDILKAIKIAKNDENIKGISLENDISSIGLACAEEIRNALIDFKKSGKFIYAYGDCYTKVDYLISSVADTICINPLGTFEFNGLVATSIHYKNLLDKIKIKPRIFRVGNYKSAIETYTRTNMSPANKEQTTILVNNLWNNILKDVSISRNIPIDKLRKFSNEETMLVEATKTKAVGFTDLILYKKQYRNMIYKINDFKINYIDVEDLAANYTSKDNYNKNKIALLYVNGEIFNSENKNGVNSEKITKQIYDFKKNKNIKAVIIRVNSPGGSAYGAEQMWKAISDLKSKKPVIISMSDYAASGGYYLSADANKIFSSKYTVTGSIGIFGMFFTLNETANELGITFDEIKTSTYSDFLNPTHEMSKIEQLQFQNYINHGYELFTKRVAQGRDMNIEKVKQIAGGRVYTGTDALNINLVDTIGGINDAISYAKKITHLNKYSIIEYPKKEDLFTTITKNLITSNKIDLLSSINNYFRPLDKVNSNLKDKFQSKAMAEMQTLKIQ